MSRGHSQRSSSRRSLTVAVRFGPARIGTHRAGVALLEVVLSLGLLLICLSIVGAAFSNCDRMTRETIERSRALMLCEQVVTYLDTGRYDSEREMSGTFGDEGPPGWAWRMQKQKDQNVPGLERVTIEIVDGDPEASDSKRRPILITHMIRAEKKNLNLKEDYGLSDDQLVKLTDAIPGGSAFLDPTDFDPTSLARLDMDTLVELLPTILQSLATMNAGGMGGGLPPGVSPDKIMDALQGAAGGGAPQANGGGGNSAGSRQPANSGGSDGGAAPKANRRGFGGQRGGGGG